MSSASYLSSFLDRNEVHIIGLSEHWLFNHNMHFLESINSEYTGFGIADNSLILNKSRNIGKGGVALLWHRSMSSFISPLDIDSCWLVGFVALRPKSTAMVIVGWSVHLTTLFPGQA